MSLYARGANFERKVKKELETDGWFVVRSAGSKGVADLVAVNQKGVPMFVQCKLSGIITKQEVATLEEFAHKYHARAFIAEKGEKGQPKWTLVRWRE
jgi:Holliday junction resolvase